MKVLFRADGGNTLGNGHWSRGLHLLSYVPGDASERRIYTRNPDDFRQAFPEHTLEIVRVTDEELFLGDIIQGDVVVVDGYFFDQAYLNKLFEKKALVIFIDDLLKESIKADFIINHTPGISSSHYTSAAPHFCF